MQVQVKTKAKKIKLRRGSISNMLHPEKSYICKPGTVIDVELPDGTHKRGLTIQNTNHWHCSGPANACMFKAAKLLPGMKSIGVCGIDVMFCLSRRPYVWFKDLDTVVEDL